jgi:hypothetical protein
MPSCTVHCAGSYVGVGSRGEEVAACVCFMELASGMTLAVAIIAKVIRLRKSFNLREPFINVSPDYE